MGLGLFSILIEGIVAVIVSAIKWFDEKTFDDNNDDTVTVIDYIVKWFEGNISGVKHIVSDNEDGTVTVITQVTYKGEIIHEWNETAKSRFLSEMKKDHKRDGKEYLKNYKLKK